MPYTERLNAIDHFSMDDFIRISKEMLPSQYRTRPWLYINHGVDLLATEEQLCAYIAAYGEMHQIKCKVSYQNFDFDSISTIEIIDWGCGQGIGSLTFIDMLRDREKLQFLRKVTLIEPSTAALNRATINIQKATYGSIQVLPINRYLPGNGTNNEIEGIDYTQPIVIHIFSNILDIPTVNLERLAHMVGTPNRTHHIMCMGPKNTNSYRIDKFCSAFNVNENAYSSKIDNPCFGHTSDTHHNFSCVTRCLKYNGEGINSNNMDRFVEPTLICGHPILDDYDPMLAVQNKLISKDICNIYSYLGQKLNDTDHVYLKPVINGDTPDIVILRPDTGIMVIKVFEDDINEYTFCNDNGNKIDYNSITNGEIRKTSPIVIVKSYQRNLIQLHIKDMLGRSLINKKYWSVIKTVVYFSKNTTEEVKQKFNDAKISPTVLLGNDIINDANFDILQLTNFNRSSNIFDRSISDSFLRIISQKWHSYRQGIHTNLTRAQQALAKSEPSPRRKINGVAGSGKTQVLATRAVNANLRTGKKILILTYNLTLVNYIKYRIGLVRADFSWDMFLITNYHQLFITEANNHGLKMNLTSFENTRFFETEKDNIKKYSAIFIDEVQDYQTSWLDIIREYFLEPDGEIAVFGDAKQNIYGRPLDTNGQVRIGFIPGEWNNSLNTGLRFTNPQLSDLATNFQRTFFTHIPADLIQQQQQQQQQLFTCIRYYNVGNTVNPNLLASNCRWIMQEFNINRRDIVVLSQTCDILRDLDYSYRSVTNYETMTTFESKEQYDYLRNIYDINDNTPVSFNFRNDIKQIRRNKKIHFSMDTPALKISTIHSFKGWESPTVILILEPELNSENPQYTVRETENTVELIYTAITRCKENLFIINCGNEKYHNFFNNFCN